MGHSNNRNMSSMRRAKGSSLIELAVGMVVIVSLLVISSDLFGLIFGTQLNDSTCQDAARVAASGDPSTAPDRASAIVARANAQASGVVSHFTLVSVTQTADPSSYVNGGPVRGNVTVETQAYFTPQVVKWICGSQNHIRLTSKQSCPFTYVKAGSS